MTKTSTRAMAVVERLRDDLGSTDTGGSTVSMRLRIEQEVLRLRGEGQEDLANELAAYGAAGNE